MIELVQEHQSIECRCQHCNQPITFEPERVGETVGWSHCHLDTQLYLPLPIPPARARTDWKFNIWVFLKISAAAALASGLGLIIYAIWKFWAPMKDLLNFVPAAIAGLIMLALGL